MSVHNVMEDLVTQDVNDLFDAAEKTKEPWLTCSCKQCRLDTICYVLNRIPPKYIKSGRGLAYSRTDTYIDKTQVAVDISRLSLEGMKQVLSTRRPHGEITELPVPPVFNFPTIVGKVLNGLTFEPEKNLSVSLLLNGKLAESINLSWENPYVVSSHTPGAFSFWVKPQKAAKNDQKQVFHFEIRVEAEGYSAINYYFELGLQSQDFLRTAYTAEHTYTIPDLHLFSEHDEYDAMQY